MAADCALEYVFEPAVWWTIAKRSASAYLGRPRRMRSFAPHASRERISGESATEIARRGIRSVGLQTYWARTRRTRPRVLICSRFDGPVQYGLPIRQPGLPRSRPGSGASSASGAASRHPLHRPLTDLVRNETSPLPCQCKPTRLNLGAPTDCRPGGTSRATAERPAP